MHFGADAMPRLHDILNFDITKNNLKTLSMDWSEFDTTIPAFLVKEAFSLLKRSIDFSKLSLYGEVLDMDIHKHKYLKLFEAIERNFIY